MPRRFDPRILVVSLVAGSMLALALFGGGYSDRAVGTATAVIWIVVLVGILSGQLGRGAPPPRFIALGSLLAGLLALTAISLSWSADVGAGFTDVVRLAGYLGVFVLVGLLAKPPRAGMILAGIAVGAIAVAVVALGTRLLGIGDGDVQLATALLSAGGRLSFPIGYWNALGAIAALALPVLCRLGSGDPRRVASRLALAAFAPQLLVVYMTSSRGAVLAAILGLGVTIGLAADGRRSAAAAAIGIGGALPAIVVATLASGILDTAGDGSPGGSELAVIAALLAGMAVAGTLGPGLVGRLAGSRPLGLHLSGRTVLAGALVIVVALVVLAGPSSLIGDFRGGTGQTTVGNRTVDTRTAGIFSASGSGRTQFWGAAIDAFGSEPARGIGAGSFTGYWNENGSQGTPARNAHSEPLELLAELGPLGAVLFVVFFVLVLDGGRRRDPEGGDGTMAAATGVVAAGLVGFAIDWTWQVPAVVVPVLIASAVIGSCAAEGSGWRLRFPRLSPAATALSLVLIAVPVLWAASTLAVASARLDASTDAMSRGQLVEAATAARAAAAIEPWASAPWLQLAAIEQSGDNLPAAMQAVGMSIERAPRDREAWLLAAVLQSNLGAPNASLAYAVRASALTPGAR